MRGFLGGFVAALVVLALVVFAAVETGAVPARADGAPLPGERWAARTSLKTTIAREAPKPAYPYPPSDADIAHGATLYVQNCAVCHGTANTTPNAIARGFGVIKPPQFNKNDVTDDPEDTVSAVNGYRVGRTGDRSLGRRTRGSRACASRLR
jgi:mono/diheme cytochrome c family protein